MKPSSRCPPEDDWLAFLDGAMVPDGMDEHEVHLDECPACRRLTAAIIRGKVASQRSKSEPSPGPSDRGSLQGARLGRYLLLERLGEGGMGLVYLAYDPELDRRVAIKLIRRGLAAEATAEHQRLLFEARALARVSHPNVLKVHDVGELDGQIFVAMELVTGPSLRSWSEGRRWRELLVALSAAGRGLEAAHQAGLVHGDFKPDNVLVTASGLPLVTDFGLAAVIEGNGGAPVWGGTPAYMAPELSTTRRASPGSDQYAFCVSALELLARTPRAPPRLLAALRRGAAPEPTARHASMAALLAELAEVPSRERWRTAIRSVVATVLVALIATVGVERTRTLKCASAGELDGVWGATERAAVHAAFVASAVPLAETSWHGVAAQLDRAAAAWASEAQASCRAAPWWGATPAHSQRETCLAAVRGELQALTSELATADDDVVREGPRAVELLTPPESCASPSPPRPVVVPGDDQERRLVGAMAQLSLGRARPAAATLRQLVTTMAPTHPAAPVAWERYLWALHRSDAFDEADVQMLEALAVEARAGRDDLLVRSAAGYAVALADRRARLAEAERWIHFAQGAHARLFRPDPALTLLIAQARVTVLARANRALEAEAAAREAVALAEGSVGAPPGQLARALEALASVLVLQVKLDEAEAVARRSLESWKASVGEADVALLPVLQTLGSVALGRGKPELALEWTERALAIARGGFAPDSLQVARLTLNHVIDSMQLERTEHLVAEAEAASKVLEERLGALAPEVLTARAVLGSAQALTGDFEKAFANCAAALRGLEQSGTDGDHPAATRELANTLGCVSTSLLGLGRPREAQPHLERAVTLFEREDQVPVQRAFAKRELARCLVAIRERRLLPRARQLARESIELFERLGMRSDADDVRVQLAALFVTN